MLWPVAGKVCYLHREGLLSKSIQALDFVDVHELGFCGQDPTTSKTAPEEEMGGSTRSAENAAVLTANPRAVPRAAPGSGDGNHFHLGG